MPTRVVSIHVCWPYTPIFKRVLNFYMTQTELFKSKDSSVELSRVKIHTGEETEMRYMVKSYGIPIELLPLTGTNNVKMNYHNQWMKTRKLVEGNQLKDQLRSNCGYKPEYECRFGNPGDKLSTIVECPCSSDVVFRNGTQSNKNPGNAMYRNCILAYWEGKHTAITAGLAMSSCTDEDDRRFRDELLRTIEVENGGRFLEWDKSLNVWVQMSDKAKIQRKVSMTFYNCTKRRNTSTNVNKKRRGRSSDLLAYQFIEKKRAKEGMCCFHGGDDNASGSASSDDDEMPNKRVCV